MIEKRLQLSDTVRDVLRRSTVLDRTVILPEQLSRERYLEVDAALRLLGGKWDRSGRCHKFTEDVKDRLRTAIDVEGSVVDVKKTYQEFETPDDVADHMVRLLMDDQVRAYRDMWLLEPSAGSGQLLRALQRYEARSLEPLPHIVAVELQERLHVGLHTEFPQWSMLRGDFLNFEVDDLAPIGPGVFTFEFVLMNPPFTRNQGIKHVLHALGMLKPGGRLVACLPSGFQYKGDKQSQKFREVCAALPRYGVYDVPDGAFKSSGTAVRTCLVVLETGLNTQALLKQGRHVR